MSKSMDFCVRLSMALVAIALVAVTQATGNAAEPAKPTAEASRVFSYKQDGATYFALSLQPPASAAPATASSDIVVLFDTSASQVGDYRTKALAVLRGMLATLGEKDRVHLYSVDIGAVPLTKSFVAPKSAEMDAAACAARSTRAAGLDRHGRSPRRRRRQLFRQCRSARAAIYIGDGVNNAGAIGDDLHRAVDQLAKARVSVTSYAIGPQVNGMLLAAVANQTGGMFVVDHEKFGAKDAGRISPASRPNPLSGSMRASCPRASKRSTLNKCRPCAATATRL